MQHLSRRCGRTKTSSKNLTTGISRLVESTLTENPRFPRVMEVGHGIDNTIKQEVLGTNHLLSFHEK
jgi:hypothetical protein